MPISKRNKTVSLTKTKKAGIIGKKSKIDKIRECYMEYENIIIFSFENMRTNYMRELREDLKSDSIIFLGKNKLISIALGRTEAEELGDNLREISKRITGNRGIIFSDKPIDDLAKKLKSVSVPDYPRYGNVAIKDVFLEEGKLSQFPSNLEPHLRKLGLPTVMNKGDIHLCQPYEVCHKGDKLTPNQAKILKLFDEKMALFKIQPEYTWSKNGEFEDLTKEKTKKTKSKTKSKVATVTENPIIEMDVDT